MPGALLFDAPSAAQVSRPELLWDFDAVNASTENLSGVTSLGGLTVTEANSGSPTTWRILNGTGIEITGSGTGRLRVDWADIGTDLMARALADEDTIVAAVQFGAAFEAATASLTEGNVTLQNTANTNTAVSAIRKEAANNRRVAHWNGSGITVGVQDDLQNARSTAMWAAAGSSTTISYWSTDLLSETAPLATGTEYFVRDSNTGSYVQTGPGEWDKEDTGSHLYFWIERKAGETVATIIERLQLWLIPGKANS